MAPSIWRADCIDATAVDSGAWTDKVYAFCFPRLNRRIWPVKGFAGHHVPFAPSRGKVKGGRLFLVGVDTIKTTIISRLTRGQSIRFAGHLGDEYFAQLASERKVVRYSRGQPLVRFERKVGARAEALDCLVYAWAARAGAQIQFDQRVRVSYSRSRLPCHRPHVSRAGLGRS